MECRPLLVTVLIGSLFLTGCRNEAHPAQKSRSVLVAHPGRVAEAGLTAYAGEIRAREESLLSFRVGGKLISRDVDVGDRVRKGQILAILDAGDLAAQARAAQAQLSAAEAELWRAQADQRRFGALVERQLISRSAMDAQEAAAKAALGRVNAARANLEVARNQSAYTHLLAPEDGVIAARTAEAGQVVAAGQTVFALATDGGREAAIALPEARIREFAIGQRVHIELWSAPNQPLQGTIREIAPAADPQARTYAARVSLAGDAAKAVELGQSARVFIADQGERAALTVPLNALQRDGRTTAVWLVDPLTGKLQLRQVTVGAYSESAVPVLAGLSRNDWVVVAGGHLLREQQVVVPVDRLNRPIRSL